MNERIQELAFEANKDLDGNVPIGFAEKFAELIVRECVETLGTYENTWTHEEQMNLLKKHFGVES